LSEVFQPVPKLETGVAGLDQITLGGLPRGRTTLVSGTTGTGKTLVALEFLARGIQQHHESGVFITFEERPQDIRRNAASLGLDIAAWERAGRWAFVDASDAGPESEEIVGSYDFGGLMARVGHAVRGIEAERVSFDSVGAVFSRFADAAVVRSELQRVAAALGDLGVTSLLTAERTEEYGLISRFSIEEFVADNVVVLRNVLEQERRRRTVEILKLRGAPHRTGEWLFTIDPKQGQVVLPLSVMGPGGRHRASA
jgi:circadian clock protein KaiC